MKHFNSFKLVKAVCLRLFIVFLFAMICVGVLISTTPGLKLATRVASHWIPGELKIEQLEGRLWQAFQFNNLNYQHQDQIITIKSGQVQWKLTQIYPFKLALIALELNECAIHQEHEQYQLNAKLKSEHDVLFGTFILGDNQLNVSGPINGPFKIQAQLSNLKQIHPSLGVLDTQIQLNGVLKNSRNGYINIHFKPGKYFIQNKQSANTQNQFNALLSPKLLQMIEFDEGHITAKLDNNELNLAGFGILDKLIEARINFNLPQFSWKKNIHPNQLIMGDIRLHVPNLNALDNPQFKILMGELGLFYDAPSGQLDAKIQVSGPYHHLSLTGLLDITKGKVAMPYLGLNLDPIQFHAQTDGQQWQATANITSNHGTPLQITGEGMIKPALTGQFKIQGEQVVVMNTPEYFMSISPSLKFLLKPDQLYLSGELFIPKAHIAPISFIHSVRLTRDVQYANNQTNPNPWGIHSNLKMNLGDDVTVDIKGLQGHVIGSLQLQQPLSQPMNANGKLALAGGYYEAYGQKLNIEQGELVYSGQPLDNPYLRIRAIRQFMKNDQYFESSDELFDFSDENLFNARVYDKTTVGIIVRGKLDAPKVRLFSEPPNLSQADTLSMLLIGKPADRASRSSGRLLFEAMKALHLDKGSKGLKMIEDFQKSLGVDFDVQNSSFGTSRSDWSRTSIKVGKSITKRIYLQYNVGIFQENSSVFTLTYLLNKFLNVKVSASDVGSGIDFTYTHSE